MSAMIMKQRTSCAGKYNVVVLVCVCERGVCFLILLLLLGIIYLFVSPLRYSSIGGGAT